MNDAVRLASEGLEPGMRAHASPRFPAQVGRFEDPAVHAVIDSLVGWVMQRYREDLATRPSKHVYLRTLPRDVLGQIDRLRDAAEIRDRIARHFGDGWAITPMQDTDELYISHYNKDRGGDQGLFDKHYDGNLRFLPSSCVVRALIYLQSDAAYKVVFAGSGVEKEFATYEYGLLDFHRELHWVEGEFNPGDLQRILLKCNYLVAPRDAVLYTRLVRAANTGVFFVVKAAMEYSKSPANPPQVLVGFLCNLFRRMNNLHPFVPFAFIALVAAAIGWGLRQLLL